MSFSFARMRSRRVFRWSWKDPWRDLPQIKVKPKNAKVSGLPSPRGKICLDSGRRIGSVSCNLHGRLQSGWFSNLTLPSAPVAIQTPMGSFTTYSLPVSRRTHSRCGPHTRAVTYTVTSYTKGFSHFVTSMTAPVASGWSGWPGGACTRWKAPPCHGAHE